MLKSAQIIPMLFILATTFSYSQKIEANKAEILKFQRVSFSSTKKLDSAIVAEKSLLVLAKDSKKLESTIISDLRISDFYLNQHNAKPAIEFAKAALTLAQEDQYSRLKLHANLNLAQGFEILNDKQTAFNYYSSAEKIAQKFKIQNRDAIDAIVGQGMLASYSATANDSTAVPMDYFSKATTLAKAINDEKAIIDISTYKEELALKGEKPNFDEIAKTFQKAMDYYKASNNVAEMSRMHLLFAKLYEKKGNEKAAIAYYSANLKLNAFDGNDLGDAKANNAFAKYLTKIKKFAPASALFAKALQIKKSAGVNLNDLATQAKLVSEGFARTKNYKGAYENLELYNNLSNKIIKENRKLEDSISQKNPALESNNEKVKFLPIPQTLTKKESDTQKDLFFVLVVFALGAIVLLYIAYRKKAPRDDDDDRINTLKARLLHNISQEFITPLNTMKQPLEHLQNAITNDIQKENIIILKDTTEHVLKLVDQLVRISKIERGSMELHPRNGQIFNDITTIIQPFVDEAERDGHTLIVNIEPLNETTFFDGAVLENIISIFLANAFYYSNDKSPIYFSAVREKKYLKLGFSHNSGKLTKREVDRLFEQFSSHVENINGSGIGFELLKNLIKLYDGKIETKLNENGLHFSVLLPWNLKNVTQKNKNINPSNKKKLLLVAANDKRDRNEILLLLENDYRGIETDNGASALSIAKQRRPDAVISYQDLHGMNGSTLAQCIKADPETVSIPVILISSSNDMISNYGNISSADATLDTPIDGTQLRSYLSEFVPEKI